MPLATDKLSGITEDLPCGGSTLFAEDFEAGIPATWTVIDVDGLTPMPQTLLQPGWQSRQDYRDTLNHLAVSPAWYTLPASQSDDWLISPAIAIGSNSCLSWRVYSQDQYFKEDYEVRVATQPTITAFNANPALKTVTLESATPHFSTASLQGYAGQTVYVAFRQNSLDKFVLCLDDVKVSNVNNLDIGVRDLTYGTPDPLDTVTIRFQVANYGSDTITSFQAIYTVDGGPAKFMTVSAVSLAPNSTVAFNHDSLYVSDSLDANHVLCAWTNLPNSVLDQDQTNDTLCATLTIGQPVAVAPSQAWDAQMEVFPNPFSDLLHLRFLGLGKPTRALLQLYDLQGKLQHQAAAVLVNGNLISLEFGGLAPGMYFLKVTQGNGQTVQQKLIKH
jgi:hypothetical protein